MQYVVIAVCVVLLFAFFVGKEAYDDKKRNNLKLKRYKEAYGAFSDRILTPTELENVRSMFKRKEDPDSIDDITCNDIEFDRIFMRFDNCASAPGREYFYYRLRTPVYDEKEREDFEKKVSFLKDNSEARDRLAPFFLSIGNMRGVNFSDCLNLCAEAESKNIITEFIPIVLIIVSIVSLIFGYSFGVVLLIGSLVYNIISYYGVRGKIEIYIVCYGYMINFLNSAEMMIKKTRCAELDEFDEMEEKIRSLKPFIKKSRFVVNRNMSQTGAGNPFELVADYLRMALHIDIIGYYRMLDELKSKSDEIYEVYSLLGKLECYTAVSSLRTALDAYCIPVHTDLGIDGVNIHHPLLSDPVKNSIRAKEKGVLITGSNASGKSTFLKTVLINALFAKSINTCMADSFSVGDYRILSSMTIRDDIESGESYFMAEIKAIKRILDAASQYPVLCFVDEVLRGTNTIERIAASSKVLKALQGDRLLCFAATHDLELTGLMCDDYDNYYFDETIEEDDIIFNYTLKKGRAATRNAIKLLSVMGFPQNITDEAGMMAADFEKTGIWRN